MSARNKSAPNKSAQIRRSKSPNPKKNNVPPILLAFNKPFNVLSQFTGEPHLSTLADYIDIPNVYPAGRLDKDSEGLLLLTNHGPLQARIAEPKFKLPKTYWVLVEGEPDEDSLDQLRQGVELKDGRTQPAQVQVIDEPEFLWPRNPPVRVRKSIQDTWLKLTIKEGKNRQVRRMTAHIGFPTLRLIRASIGPINLTNLQHGEWRYVSLDELPPKLLSAVKK